jgi:hypothetical protein
MRIIEELLSMELLNVISSDAAYFIAFIFMGFSDIYIFLVFTL